MENQAPKKSWLARYWWAVIVVLLLVMGLSCVICVGGGFYGIVSLMKSNPAFADSLAMVQENPRAQQLLGTPIEAGWFVSGEVNVTPASGTAELSYPVSGPKGSGTVYVSARKIAGEWVITSLYLVMEKTGEKIIITPD